VHIYRELAEREVEDEKRMRAPIYIAVDGGSADEEVAVRLPKEIAMRFLMPSFPSGPTKLGKSSKKPRMPLAYAAPRAAC
jgi:hypothetical protein